MRQGWGLIENILPDPSAGPEGRDRNAPRSPFKRFSLLFFGLYLFNVGPSSIPDAVTHSHVSLVLLGCGGL